MSFIGFLLAAAGVGLSISYSGALAVILENGSDLTWLKNFGALDPVVLCAVAAGILAVLGALLLLGKKKLSALLLFAAAGIQAYVAFGLELSYPYLIASIGLFAVAGLCGCLTGSRSDAEEDEDEAEEAEEPAPAPVYEPVKAEAAPEPEPAEAEAESEPVKAEAAPEPVKSAPAPVEPAPVSEPEDEEDDEDEAEKKSTPASRFPGVLLALAGAGVSLFFSGVWELIAEHGTDLTWLKEFGALEPLPLCVIGAAALAVLAVLFHLGRKKFAALLLLASAGILAYAEYGLEIEYPYWYAGAALYAAAALRALCAGGSGEGVSSPRRYSGAYVCGFIFAIAAAALALHQSGVGAKICAAGGLAAFADAVMSTDCQTQAVALISALGVVGGVFSLLAVPFASWLLLAAMLLSLAAELMWTSFYAFSWIALLLFALAALLSAAVFRASDDLPAKRLTLGGAFILMLLAAAAGGALSWYASQGVLAEKLASARDNDPAYKKIIDESAAKDAKIAEIENQLKSQTALIAERDANISGLTDQSGAKDEEIKNLVAQTAGRDEQIAALQAQVEELKAGLKESQDVLNRRYIFVRGKNNVRNVPNSRPGSKIISRLTDEVAEVFDIQRPEGSSADWYQVKGSFGTGWVFGGNAVLFDLKK